MQAACHFNIMQKSVFRDGCLWLGGCAFCGMSRRHACCRRVTDSNRAMLVWHTCQADVCLTCTLQENVALIKEINELRREVKAAKHSTISVPSGTGSRKPTTSPGGLPSRRTSKETSARCACSVVRPALTSFRQSNGVMWQ